MTPIGTFPFGQPIMPVVQRDRTKKQAFFLGVYASAVHAQWKDEEGTQKINAVAVASEPSIFWRGCQNAAQEIIDTINKNLPPGTGKLSVPVDKRLNGPSGKALDKLFLEPLGFKREDVWLCDLVPHSCMNERQKLALQREYDPMIQSHGLPEYNWPALPHNLTDSRRSEIEKELLDSESEVVITLGDMPLKWFTRYYRTKDKLSDYGQTMELYGQLQEMIVDGKKIMLLPLVHPRQAAGIGSHSSLWKELHKAWIMNHPRGLSFTKKMPRQKS